MNSLNPVELEAELRKITRPNMHLLQLQVLGFELYVAMWADEAGKWQARGYHSLQYAREFIIRQKKMEGIELEIIPGDWSELAWILQPKLGGK